MGQLSPTAVINLHNIVNKEVVRGFIVQMAKRYEEWFEELLVDIVKQTRSRNDITQASANAMTLLNQMHYSFAHQDFRGVKIRGACLRGANLTKTNLEKAELQFALLEDCTLTKTNLEDANLAGVELSGEEMKEASEVQVGWETGKRLRTLTGHSEPIWSVCFSPNGALIAFASKDNKIIVWATGIGQQVRTLIGHLSLIHI